MKKTFDDLGLSSSMLRAIKSKGFEEPTEIQEKIIPLILKNEVDLIGQAQTGTGKTAAFALPILDQLDETSKKLQCLILAPTRELAIQVSEEINSLKGSKNLHVAPIYGGQSYDTQLRHIKKGLAVIVGTPGRLIDHLNRGSFKIENLKFLVLDEADEMLNMGFIDDIEDILSRTNKEKRTLMFSATMPDRIIELTKRFMGKSEVIKTKLSGKTTALTDQLYFEVKESDKFESLCRIIDTTNEFYGIVFCRTKSDVDYITQKLHDRDYDADSLHGDISQTVREKILAKFKSRKVNVLIATDVAARGLDVYDMTHVINYSIPQDPEAYLHRIGRTGRAGKEGTAITFVTPEEFRKLAFIKNITKTEIRKERVPKISDVINFKKAQLSIKILELLKEGTSQEYIKLANEFLIEHSAEEIIAALIKNNYQNELEEKSYSHIHDLFDSKKGDRGGESRFTGKGRSRNDDRGSRSDDRKGRGEGRDRRGSEKEVRGAFKEDKGKARMFLAMGKKDDLDVKGILKFIKKKTNLPEEKITGIQLSEAFSFFNVPLKDADHVYESMNANSKKRLLVERAKSVQKSNR